MIASFRQTVRVRKLDTDYLQTTFAVAIEGGCQSLEVLHAQTQGVQLELVAER